MCMVLFIFFAVLRRCFGGNYDLSHPHLLNTWLTCVELHINYRLEMRVLSKVFCQRPILYWSLACKSIFGMLNGLRK